LNGLAQVRAPWRSIVAYSTEPGGVALDGTGENSPYTAALITEILKPDIPAEQMFKQVRRSLLQNTLSQQISWESSSLTEDIFFAPSNNATDVEVLVASSRAKPEIDWDDYDWEELSRSQEANWRALGWNPSNWEGDSAEPETEEKIWNALTSKEQKAARALGYTKSSWDGTE
jgi:hypothetical protein